MTPFNYEDDEVFDLLRIKNGPSKRENRKTHTLRTVEKTDLVSQFGETQAELNFSYKASRHERQWILNSLGTFHQHHWLDDVLRLIKGGKEASVYQCAANESVQADYIAAKIYRPRKFRNLRNDHLYREGRERLNSSGNAITDDGHLHAIRKRTNLGLELMHTSWISHEFKTMQIIHAAGADVPIPFAMDNNAILMGYIGGENRTAPTLNEINLDPHEIKPLFDRVIRNVEIMLANNRIHGDLSAYNILYWKGEITLIDFPQAIDPWKHPNPYPIFKRDVTRICQYFRSQGLDKPENQIASTLWEKYGHPFTPEIHPSLLERDEEDENQIESTTTQHINIFGDEI
jgi:RIO kinase 1